MSQKELAEAACLTPAAVSRYVNGEREPRALTVAALADVLGVKPLDIIGTSIEQEMEAYLTYDPRLFRGKTVLCRVFRVDYLRLHFPFGK